MTVERIEQFARQITEDRDVRIGRHEVERGNREKNSYVT